MILYVGNFIYPDGNAAGKRIRGNIKAIESSGDSVACFGFRSSSNKYDSIKLKREVLESTICYSIPYCDGFKRLNNRYPFECLKKILRRAELNKDRINLIIMYGSLGSVLFNIRLLSYCKKNNIKVCYDLADWFEKPRKNNFLRYIAKKTELFMLKHHVLPKCDGWIVISKFLHDRMPDKSKTIIVPPLSDCSKKANIDQNRDKIRISYASFLGSKSVDVSLWKDRIDIIIDLFYDLRKGRNINNFELYFIGFDKTELIQMFEEELRSVYTQKLEYLKDNLVFKGRCSNQMTQDLIRSSDFTILLRDSKVSTNAGFPTKVSESISVGIPVLVNATSDISDYIDDGRNGFILPDPSNYKLLLDKMQTILSLDFNVINQMKTFTSEDNPFYFERYKHIFKNFIKEIER